MKMKFIMLFMMWVSLICGGPATGVSIVMASIPVLDVPPPNAEIGAMYRNSGSGSLCTYIEEKYAGRENKFWSKDFRNESVECKPANTGTLPIILLPDAEHTEIFNVDIMSQEVEYYYKKIPFEFNISNAVLDTINNNYQYVIKIYIVDRQAEKLFKIGQYKYFYKETIKGEIIFSWPDILYIRLTDCGSQDTENIPQPYLDLNTTGSGIYDFLIEVIDPENNRSWAAVPINVQYIAPQ